MHLIGKICRFSREIDCFLTLPKEQTYSISATSPGLTKHSKSQILFFLLKKRTVASFGDIFNKFTKHKFH